MRLIDIKTKGDMKRNQKNMRSQPILTNDDIKNFSHKSILISLFPNVIADLSPDKISVDFGIIIQTNEQESISPDQLEIYTRKGIVIGNIEKLLSSVLYKIFENSNPQIKRDIL